MEKVLNQEEIDAMCKPHGAELWERATGGNPAQALTLRADMENVASQAASHGIASEVTETDRKILANRMVEQL